jgi:hypothetical protein
MLRMPFDAAAVAPATWLLSPRAILPQIADHARFAEIGQKSTQSFY